MDIEIRFMKEALLLAHAARDRGEVPVGAVIVKDQTIIGSGFNMREKDQDPTSHAELNAIRDAAATLGSWRLEGCDLYVTLEPCAMCAGGIVQARIRHLVFGACDPKAGFCGTLGNLVQDPRLNHRVELTGGLLKENCQDLLVRFFQDLR